MAAAVSMPVWQFSTADFTDLPLLSFLLVLAGFIMFTHRSNIQRMLYGEEHRMEKAMLLRRLR
jgi:glycerol-3-phosphate acyltransferase PlsY